MTFKKYVAPKVFRAIQNVNIEDLSKCTEEEIRPILPCLVRMSLISPLDTSKKCSRQKMDILTIISGIELVNSIVALLSIDFHVLEADVKKEQQLRQKVGTNLSDSVLIGNLPNGLALEYERSDMTRRLRLVLSELLFIQSQIQDNGDNHAEHEFYVKNSELFDNDIYIEEISDVICIALAELPTLLSVINITEILLHVLNGPTIISRVVANFPDSFREVCTSLIQKGEKQEENLSSAIRGTAISMLCKMNPSQALSVRSKCVDLCRMPALAISLSLDINGRYSVESDGDMVAFVSGLLLGNDQTTRNWFALFIRTGQKRKGELSSTALQQLRDELLRRLQVILDASRNGQLPDDLVVQASALLRLYCALRGIAGIKFQDDEVNLIVQLLISHPSPTPAGVRFVSIGLCMLIACPSLVSSPEHERKSIEWVQWLVKEEAYFESASGVTASFGEMLLLMAIHFHSNQLSAICDLVCATLGMKIPIRHNNMTRMKQVFTQEIFTEQVVTAHAVKVPVTNNLNANMTGFLPIHCIHQLLKSRAFAKHNVNIKNWIYKQICVSINPLHPVLPLLVDVYVNSIILPNAKYAEQANKPLSENEIRRVFQSSVFGPYFNERRSIFNLDFDMTENHDIVISETSLTPQLLLLYYLLLYEDCRLNNAHSLALSGRKIKTYSPEFLSELPIKYLLHHAQKDQSSYSTLFGPLLKLLATHFPHLTLVEDWLDDMSLKPVHKTTFLSEFMLVEAFNELEMNPSKCAKLLQLLLKKEAIDIWPFAEVITQFSKNILGDKVPRYLQELYKDVWLKLNTVLPRRLWVLTVKNLVGDFSGLTRIDVAEDPLQIMRCDERVFRCAPLYAIVLRVLRASLASSRSQLYQHLQSNPRLDQNGQVVNDTEREEMCRALIAAQLIEFTVMDKRPYNRRSDYASERKRFNSSYNDRKSFKKRRASPEKSGEKPPDSYKHELARFLEDQCGVRNPEDFWRFHQKYKALRSSKPQTDDFDKTKLFNLNFQLSFKELHEKLPILDKHGERLRISESDFSDLLQTIKVYQDFQQKMKFAKIKKLRTAQNDLPIAKYKQEIIEKLSNARVMLIAGDTGCGKSTQVPQYILEAGYKKLVCTQPRRLACVSLAKRVSYETLSDFKNTIGYQIRFEKTKRKDTSVIFMTEGLLLRQSSEEETLNSYDVIILDEVHERHLHGDFLVGIMKCLLHNRDDFKLILMSATINLKLFSDYFAEENVAVIQVPGRLYPVELHYKPIIKDPYEKKQSKFDCTPYLQILQLIDEKYPAGEKGDLLVFLNGFSEITALGDAVREYSARKGNWIVLLLHSTLSLEEQDKVFDYPPEGVRKCIISTNIAETSVTIDGVRFVIDSGKVNRMSYLSEGGVNRLTECNISQDSAKQRSGRAGRTGPGICFRLYSEEDYRNFEAFTPAEIHLVPLESLLLHMISLGLSDISNFPFLEKPSDETVEESLEKLKFCGALSLDHDDLSLTSLGEKMGRLPVDLSIAKMLILSTVFGNVSSVLALAALLNVQSPYTQNAFRNSEQQEMRKPHESNHGDPITLLNLYKEWLLVKQKTGVESKGRENSKTWARKRGLEEQRFYEVTKLLEQFREILVDAELLPKIAEAELSSSERAIRHGELKQLKAMRYELKNEVKSRKRKLLKLEIFDCENAEAQGPDLPDVEFKITNDFKRLQKLLTESSADSYRDLTLLKVVLASGLYPQVAVEDEFNISKTVSEKLYHTKNKHYVFLRPMSIFATNPEILELHNDDIEIPPPGYFSKRPISRKHQILLYQSILKTKKIYLVNTMRMPALHTLLLLGKSIATNATLSRFVFDEFLSVDVPYVGQGKTLLSQALALRKRWMTKLENKLANPGGFSHDEENFNFIEDLVKFMCCEVSYNIKRLLPADLKVIYNMHVGVFEDSILSNTRNPFDPDFVIRENENLGGVQVSENVIYNCLLQEEWDSALEQELYNVEFQCPNCKDVMRGLSFFRMFQHETFCKVPESEPSEKSTVVTIKPNSRGYHCDECGKDLILTPIEILKHKKTCSH